MKRKDLKVGEHYAVYSANEDVSWRRVSKVEVLDLEPWRKTSRWDPKGGIQPAPGGSGVHVRVILSGRLLSREGTEDVVNLAQIREPWAEYEENEKQRKKADQELKTQQLVEDEEWNKRVKAVNEVLIDLGITLSHWHTPERYGGSRKKYTWELSMDEMERLISKVQTTNNKKGTE